MSFDWALAGDYLLRLVLATLAGGVLGLDRELTGHWAGLRTHMIVALGAATFALLGVVVAGGDPNAASRVIQGVATGIGFLGAGTILKMDERQKIKGLTTASSIWLAAALGVVAGLGKYELAVVCLLVAIVVLVALRPVSHAMGLEAREHDRKDQS